MAANTEMNLMLIKIVGQYFCLQNEPKLLSSCVKEELVDIVKVKDTGTSKYLHSEDEFVPESWILHII